MFGDAKRKEKGMKRRRVFGREGRE